MNTGMKILLAIVGIGGVSALAYHAIKSAKVERIFYVARGPDQTYWKESTDANWTGIGGPTLASSGITSVLKGNTLHIILQGAADSGIYVGTVNVDTKSFSGWTILPGSFVAPQTASIS